MRWDSHVDPHSTRHANAVVYRCCKSFQVVHVASAGNAVHLAKVGQWTAYDGTASRSQVKEWKLVDSHGYTQRTHGQQYDRQYKGEDNSSRNGQADVGLRRHRYGGPARKNVTNRSENVTRVAIPSNDGLLVERDRS